MAKRDGQLPTPSASNEAVDAFVSQVASLPKPAGTGGGGRLVFALDATASRQPTWDRAAHIQSEMFLATSNLGGLAVQLCFYRGYGEFKVSPWLTQSSELLRLMTSVNCRAGQTQIRKVLRHATNESKRTSVSALVFVGDCMEEDVDQLGAVAGELGLLGVPAFMFHEGNDPMAVFAFKQVAQLTRGACCRFDASAPDVLRDLLSAVAVYAAGGRAALETIARDRGGAVKLLASRMRSG